MSDENKRDSQADMPAKYRETIASAIDEVMQERADAMFEQYDYPPDPPLPKEFRQKMEALKHPPKKQKSYRLGRLAAVVCLATGIIIGSMAPQAEAYLQQLFKLLLNPNETHTKVAAIEEFGLDIAQELKEAGWDHVYYPDYLPSGYILTDFQISVNTCIIRFEKDESSIEISQRKLIDSPKSGLDSENAQEENIKILGYDAIYIQKNNRQNLVYHNNDYMFNILVTGHSKAELIKIAENLANIR